MSDILRDEFLQWTNGVWSFNGESKSRIGHQVPFPVELPRRCIKAVQLRWGRHFGSVFRQ